jgi:cell division septation protein DedD
LAHQDDYFYEIQLTNKQLVFYFMAVASALVLSFLLGIMVGRGVDHGAGEVVQAARPAQEDRIVTEETPRPAAPPAAEDLTYAKRLDSEKAEEGLEKPKGSGAAVATGPAPGTLAPARPRTVPMAPATPRPTPRATPVAATPRPAAAPGGAFAIQVGAFKDRASADSVVTQLKGKGFAAYVVTPEGEGLFNVRVGGFAERAEAEKVQARLRDNEKFKPFIVVKGKD